MDINAFSITYDSNLYIHDKSLLATLCVFYEQVYLPAVQTIGQSAYFQRKRGSEDPFVFAEIVENSSYQPMGMRLDLGQESQWQQILHLFESSGALRRLPQSEIKHADLARYLGQSFPAFNDMIPYMSCKRWPYDGESEGYLVNLDQLVHLLRKDTNQTRTFVSSGDAKDTSRAQKTALMADSVFKYLLPKLGELSIDQILEVRETVKDNREGFAMHVMKLSAELDAQLHSGDDLRDLQRYAQSVVETKLLPDYYEFVRQISAKRAGFWGNVLDKTTSLMEIDASPLTPKFFAGMLKAFGSSTLTGIAQQKDRLSNQSQAFQFMQAVERSRIIES